MGRIAILADAVASQIAAGEVVERPASVVKELVENALDAGATSITIDLEAGGRTAIAVSDDGVGMDRDDAVLAIDRHATSKIRAASDLIGVPTYGFRGEALPAIASVARFELETAPAGDNGADATSIVVEGGRLKSVDVTSRQRGTTVKVQRLFFNTPARRKFLRKPATEARAVVAAVSLLALTRLDVAFTVTSDGRVIAKAPRVSAFADRIQSLYGRELAEGLIAVDHHAGPVSVRGFIQRPSDAKPTGRKAFLFVNGRPFRDHFLVRAAEAGYRATIHPGARPTLFLSLGVPGDAVDVNVHPAKLEVRFRDRRFVEHCVEEAVRHALGDIAAAAVVRPWLAAPGRVAEGAPTPAPAFTDGPADGRPDAAAPSLFDGGLGGGMDPGAWFADGDFLQVFNTYIVMQTPDGLAIVDQHSAHERVLFEQAMKHLTGEAAPSQRLLLPITVDLEPQELEAVSHNRELLNAIGFEAEEFGGRSLVIHAVPNPHPRFDARRCFEEVVADLARGRFGGWNNELERFAATYACRAAIKAGHVLEPRETRTLLNRLFACELPPHDVHGRPTIVQLPKEELERRFGRS